MKTVLKNVYYPHSGHGWSKSVDGKTVSIDINTPTKLIIPQTEFAEQERHQHLFAEICRVIETTRNGDPPPTGAAMVRMPPPRGFRFIPNNPQTGKAMRIRIS